MDGGEDFVRSSLVENEGIDLNASCETKITHLEVSHVIFCLLLLSLFENILSRDRMFGSVVQFGRTIAFYRTRTELILRFDLIFGFSEVII